MTKKLQRLAGCLITLALIAAGVSKLGYIVRPTDADRAYIQAETFHDLPENSLEAIIYGSSHAYRGADPRELYREYGIGAYNYGWHWQSLNTTNLFLKDSLITQKPRLAIIETYRVDKVLQNTNIEAEIYYVRYLNASKARWKYLKQCFGTDPERYLSYYMPLCAFHDNWTNITKKSFYPLSSGSPLIGTMGYSSSENENEEYFDFPDQDTKPQLELEEASLAELDDIVQTCRENNVDILFYTTPYRGVYQYGDAMAEYAARNGCAYINLFDHLDELKLDGKKDFADDSHLNVHGSKKVTDYLGAYISEHYDLTDMRTISGNLWEKNLEQ